MADPIRGRFLWHELMTTDTKSAGTFYSKIIGWKLKPGKTARTHAVHGGRSRHGRPHGASGKKDGHPAWLTLLVRRTSTRRRSRWSRSAARFTRSQPTFPRWAGLRWSGSAGRGVCDFHAASGRDAPDAFGGLLVARAHRRPTGARRSRSIAAVRLGGDQLDGHGTRAGTYQMFG